MITPMQEGALALRELYGALLHAGFSEQQALTLLGVMLATQRAGKEEEKNDDYK